MQVRYRKQGLLTQPDDTACPSSKVNECRCVPLSGEIRWPSARPLGHARVRAFKGDAGETGSLCACAAPHVSHSGRPGVHRGFTVRPAVSTVYTAVSPCARWFPRCVPWFHRAHSGFHKGDIRPRAKLIINQPSHSDCCPHRSVPQLAAPLHSDNLQFDCVIGFAHAALTFARECSTYTRSVPVPFLLY